MANVRMSIMIDDELKKLISSRARENNRSVSGEINQAIKHYLSSENTNIVWHARESNVSTVYLGMEKEDIKKPVEKSNIKTTKFAFK